MVVLLQPLLFSFKISNMPQDISKLKRIQYDKNTVIYVLPHVDEQKTIEAFKSRDTSANGGLAYLGMLQNSKNKNT